MPSSKNVQPVSISQGIVSAISILAIALLIPVDSQAQTDAQQVKAFRASFERGCNQGKTSDVRNQKGYCTCMANSFQSRYAGSELMAISRSASALGDNGAAVINLMMAPEARACAAKY